MLPEPSKMDVSITFTSHRVSHPSHSSLSLQGHTDLQGGQQSQLGACSGRGFGTESHVPAQTVFSSQNLAAR